MTARVVALALAMLPAPLVVVAPGLALLVYACRAVSVALGGTHGP